MDGEAEATTTETDVTTSADTGAEVESSSSSADSGQQTGGEGAAPSLSSSAADQTGTGASQPNMTAQQQSNLLARLKALKAPFENEEQLYTHILQRERDAAEYQRKLHEMEERMGAFEPHMGKFYEWYQSEQAKASAPKEEAPKPWLQHDLPDDLSEWDIPLIHQHFEQNEQGQWIPKAGVDSATAEQGRKFLKHYTNNLKNIYRRPGGFLSELGFATTAEVDSRVSKAVQEAIASIKGELQGKEYYQHAANAALELSQRHYANDREGAVIFEQTARELEKEYPEMDKMKLLNFAHKLAQAELMNQRSQVQQQVQKVRAEAGLPAQPNPTSPAVSSLPSKMGAGQKKPSAPAHDDFESLFEAAGGKWDSLRP